MQDYNKALNYAFLLLKYRPRSKNEVSARLEKKGFTGAVIAQVIDKLQEYDYVNDKDFVRFFLASSQNKGWGSLRIERALSSLGVDKELVTAGCAAIDYRDKIRSLIDKKCKFYQGKKNAYAKLMRFLLARGFRYGDVIEEMRGSCAERLKI